MGKRKETRVPEVPGGIQGCSQCQSSGTSELTMVTPHPQSLGFQSIPFPIKIK